MMKLELYMLRTGLMLLLLLEGLGGLKAAGTLHHQQRTIQGTVVDTEGTPLAGITITLNGTSLVTTTNEEGHFSMVIPSDAEMLVFSSLGVKTHEVPIGESSNLDVVLEAEAVGLDEVIVVGYGSQKKRTITGAIATVSNEDIVERPVRALNQALTGKVPGLTVTDRGGIPGRPNGQFQIRNFGSPLVIVDGMEQVMNFMDPNEIESITVLKDAAAAIYGQRAGNGVVLITTKRGQEQPPQFNVSIGSTRSKPTQYPSFADAGMYTQLRNYALIHAGNAPLWTAEEIEKYKDGSDPLYPNTDWWSETFKKWSPMTDLNLSVRGGSNSTKYFLSLGTRDEGSMLRSDAYRFNRYNIRSNIDVKLTSRLTGSFDLSSRFENRNEPGLSFGDFDPGILQAVIRALPIYPARYPDETKPPFAGARGYNPVFASQQEWSGYMKQRFSSFRGAMNLQYDLADFVSGLSTQFKFDYRKNDTFIKNWRTGFNTFYYDYDYEAGVYSYFPSDEKFNDGKTTLNQQYNRNWDWLLNYNINYERTFNDTHTVSGMLLYEALEDRTDQFNAYREGFITNSIDQFYAGADFNKDNNGGANEGGRHSVVGRFNYAFKSKYLMEFLFRYDASPKFHPDYRWGFFPGISLGWTISDENFLKDARGIDHLKLRLSRGQTGLEGSVNFNYLSGYEFAGNYIFDSSGDVAVGVRPTGIPNITATWATNTISNAGIDGSFWNGGLSFEANVFYRLREDILTSRARSIPNTFGASLPEENLNSQDSRGWELELRHRNNIGGFRYQVFGNVSWARSKWIHYDEPEYTSDEEIFRYRQTGRWTDVRYGYLTDGLFSSPEEISEWADITNGANNANILPGDIRFLDMNNDGLIDWKDQRVIGKSNLPNTNYALGGNLSYKGLELNVLFTGATGFSKSYGGQLITPFGLDFNVFDFFKDAWTIDNPNPNAPYPRLRLENVGGHPNTDYASDFWIVENAYFIRLKELQLSYNFSKELLKPLKLNSLRFYIMAHNFAYISNIKVDDPENNVDHGRYYPQQSSISFGLNVSF